MGTASPPKKPPEPNQLDRLIYLAAMTDQMTALAGQARQDLAMHCFKLAAEQLRRSIQEETARTRLPNEIKPPRWAR